MARKPKQELTRQEKKATRDAAEQEALLREVDDAVRQGDLQSFSEKYGKPLIAGIVLGLAAFGGFLYWQSEREADRERDGEVLVGALDQVEAGNLQTGADQLDDLAANGNGAARANAKLLQAGIAAQQGRSEDAATLFAQVADEGDTPPALRDLARIRLVATRFDAMKPAEVVAAMKPLAVPGKPFFGSAAELLANAYIEQGKNTEAGALFAQIAQDEDTPESLRTRARNVASVLGVDAIEDVDALLEAEGVGQDAAAPGPGAGAPPAAN